MVGRLADGTAYFAPTGRMLGDGDRVCCHLCGRWFLSVASHLRVHGWSKVDYVAAFGLELGNPLAGPGTRRRRAAALRLRQDREPALRQAQGEARQRARSGALTQAAATAARGRPHPAERREKTLAALSAVRPAARAAGNRRRAERHRDEVAAAVAARFGYATFVAYVGARLAAGWSMAAVSREAGLHKDWVCRQLPALAPALAAGRTVVRPHPGDVRLSPIARSLGHADVAAYLHHAHLREHRTVAALAAQAGVSRSTVLAAMRRHGITPMPHASSRHRADERGLAVAGPFGFGSLAAYVAHRRGQGMTWRALVAESGLAESTLRRHGRRAAGSRACAA
ncbi:hypothetical protein GCM10010399_25480 [Dactylosporangium fulvum]